MQTFKAYIEEQEEKKQAFETKIFRVPVENLPVLEDKIKKANKVAVKLGTKPAVIHYHERKLEPIDRKKEEFREYQYLSVSGEIPIIGAGWTFAGKLEPHEAGTIVKSAPGHSLPARFHTTDPTKCDHCGTSRRRSETFIVKKGRKYNQVGRQCLKDFLGHAHPEKYALQAEWAYDLEKSLSGFEGDRGMRIEPNHSTLVILSAAISAIKRDGFVGKSYIGPKESTAATVWKYFNPPIGLGAKHHIPLNVTKDDNVDAQETIDWVKGKSKTDKSEFMTNLLRFVSVKANPMKYNGYLAAAAMLYLKEKGTIETKKKMSDGIKSEALGKEGDKVKLELEVISAFRYSRPTYHYYDSGVSQILTMKDKENRLVKMFTSNLDIQKDDRVTVTGTLGKAEPETYETSPFKGKIITTMAPRSRIALVKAEEVKKSN